MILEVVKVIEELRVNVFICVRVISFELVELLDHVKLWFLLMYNPVGLLGTGYSSGRRWLLLCPIEVQRTRSHLDSWRLLECARHRVEFFCLWDEFA